MKKSIQKAAILLSVLSVCSARAEDADRFRPYLRFHSGDVEPLWGVDDHWAFGLGANFNLNWGAELSIENFEQNLEPNGYGHLGEVSAWQFFPELRLRKPVLNGKLVPYLIAGVGPAFLQLNDKQSGAEGHSIDVEGMTVAVAAGAGIEYFLADNVAFGLEGRYVWMNPIQGKIDGDSFDVDLSAPTFTFGLRVYFDENQPTPLRLADREQPNRFYVGARVGGSWLADRAITRHVDLEPEEAAWGDINQTGGLLLGADFGPRIGIEISADSYEHRMVAGDTELGEYGMGMVVPQLRLKFPSANRRWAPYVTAGIGVAYAEFNDARDGIADQVSAEGLYPALRFGAGVEYFVASNFSFMADTAWNYTWSHKVSLGDRSASGDFSTISATIGMRIYLFNF